MHFALLVVCWDNISVGILFSLHLGAAFFLAAAMPEGPAPNPLAIGCGTTWAVTHAYCLTICTVELPPTQQPQLKEAGLRAPGLVALPQEAWLVLLPVQQQCQIIGLGLKLRLPMAEKTRPIGPLLLILQQQHLSESQDPSSPPSQLESPCLQL